MSELLIGLVLLGQVQLTAAENFEEKLIDRYGPCILDNEDMYLLTHCHPSYRKRVWKRLTRADGFLFGWSAFNKVPVKSIEKLAKETGFLEGN